jgi:hypothetical protein
VTSWGVSLNVPKLCGSVQLTVVALPIVPVVVVVWHSALGRRLRDAADPYQ